MCVICIRFGGQPLWPATAWTTTASGPMGNPLYFWEGSERNREDFARPDHVEGGSATY